MRIKWISVILCLSLSGVFLSTKPLPEPTTEAQLGEKLFFDPILSLTKDISCSSCHIPEYGFADTVAFSSGIYGRKGGRNAPSCANMGSRELMFYDGRAKSLEDQVRFPIEDQNEMGMPIAEAAKRLKQNPEYVKWFKKIYKSEPSAKYIQKAIAAYERTLETSNTPFDRYMNDDTLALSASAIRGRELFMSEKTHCFDCHFSPDFTGDEFKNIGLYDGNKLNDVGRFKVTGKKEDIGKFKVPGLRNVAATAPYMHNGMFKSLKEVVEYYNNPKSIVSAPINMDTTLSKPLNLSEQEKEDLVNFLYSLTDKRFKVRSQ